MSSEIDETSEASEIPATETSSSPEQIESCGFSEYDTGEQTETNGDLGFRNDASLEESGYQSSELGFQSPETNDPADIDGDLGFQQEQGEESYPENSSQALEESDYQNNETTQSPEAADDLEPATNDPPETSEVNSVQESENPETMENDENVNFDETAKEVTGHDTQDHLSEDTQQYYIGEHISEGPNNYENRGWSLDSIRDTVDNPSETYEAQDRRYNEETEQRNNDPATAFVNSEGDYVVVNDNTNDVVQVSDRNDPDWKRPKDWRKK